MSDKQPETLFLTPQKTHAVIECPQCENTQEVDFSSDCGAKTSREVVFECASCHHKKTLKVESRRYYRKPVYLPGTYYKAANADEHGEIVIKNISKGGLLMQAGRRVGVVQDEKLRVSFKLDDENHSLIEKSAFVRYQNNTMVNGMLVSLIGVEFASSDHPDELDDYFSRIMPDR